MSGHDHHSKGRSDSEIAQRYSVNCIIQNFLDGKNIFIIFKILFSLQKNIYRGIELQHGRW